MLLLAGARDSKDVELAVFGGMMTLMGGELPAGTVTFLFTDIEGSTRLLRERGDADYYDSKLRHIGLGARHRGKPTVLFVADRDVRIVTEEGELLRELVLDPSRDHQPQSARCLRCLETSSSTSRHITTVAGRGFEP